MAPLHYTDLAAGTVRAVITMSTVGYGDMVPMSDLGKVLASVASLSGVLVSCYPPPPGQRCVPHCWLTLRMVAAQILAVPISVISANFFTEHHKMVKLRRIKDRDKRAAETAVSSSSNHHRLLGPPQWPA